MKVSNSLQATDLRRDIQRVFELAAKKTLLLDRRWNPAEGAPVFTIGGKYAARGWTQWTQGFQYGNALLSYDITDDPRLLAVGQNHALHDMPEHLTHMGVHDHGFNTLSTYGQLYRMYNEGRLPKNEWHLEFLKLAIKTSGAVQAARWTSLSDGLGYIYSFNGPQSLFIDTIRTVRVCGVAHVLGYTLLGEQDKQINLLQRLIAHARTTAKFNIFYGEGRDHYDRPELRGRTAHETLFNVNNGSYRAPSSQQGYSPFSTWTRGLGWAMLGFAEQYEFLYSLPSDQFLPAGSVSKAEILDIVDKAACAACDFYINQASAADGICYWDTGAPGLYQLGDWRSAPADPYNTHEPVDASASAIAAQGLIRLGNVLGESGRIYLQAGLTIAKRLFEEEYLSADERHEGILRHSIYHRPNGWDHIAEGAVIPYGESSMWGDYHLLELAFLIARINEGKYYTFF